MQTKLILFDLGNVIVSISFQKTLENWSKLTGLSIEEILSRVDMEDEVHYTFEQGDIAPSRFRRHISERIGHKFTDKEFDEGWNSMILGVVPGIEDILLGLKKNFRLAILSNTNKIHEDYFMRKYWGTMRHFEKIFLSNKMHARKPENRAFQIVLDSFKIKPEETVFLDDNIINVEASEKMGFKGVWVTSLEDVTAGLKKFGCLN
jgi:glucose-1-phosphatase